MVYFYSSLKQTHTISLTTTRGGMSVFLQHGLNLINDTLYNRNTRDKKKGTTVFIIGKMGGRGGQRFYILYKMMQNPNQNCKSYTFSIFVYTFDVGDLTCSWTP